VKKFNINEQGVRIFRRYLKFAPGRNQRIHRLFYFNKKLDEAALKLAYIVNSNDFTSKRGRSKHQLLNELCNLIVNKSIDVDAVIRRGVYKFTNQAGSLWNCLADYYIRSGLFEKARDIYEEAIQTVTCVKDFMEVFDTYAQFEEL